MAIGENEQGFWAAGASGAASGAALGAYLAAPTGGWSIAAGAALGGVIGLLGGGAIGNAQANSARRAKVNAQSQARELNRATQINAAGAQQQADSLVMANSNANTAGGQQPGFIGANMPGSVANSSGTF